MFFTIGFLARHILGIVGSQIKTKRIFSLAIILINLRKCCLQTKKFKKLIFVNKNWPNDLRIGCKCPYNLLKFLEKDINSKEEFEKFEGEFEKYEIIEVQKFNQ
jgi:hypothetical protein